MVFLKQITPQHLRVSPARLLLNPIPSSFSPLTLPPSLSLWWQCASPHPRHPILTKHSTIRLPELPFTRSSRASNPPRRRSSLVLFRIFPSHSSPPFSIPFHPGLFHSFMSHSSPCLVSHIRRLFLYLLLHFTPLLTLPFYMFPFDWVFCSLILGVCLSVSSHRYSRDTFLPQQGPRVAGRSKAP